ncbi:hypothetical protein MtrunA17_Chr2g0285651 [Medicago truncatula]|uniref:Uncharacterized protein n=1 Tax=Medicago truncatula TaxID=3880 RepID=A0A396J2K8_MEDTR|nr:hypothetical protein MtrunA17_Chr2g0285651 [Medicago truncatula]
MFTSQHIFQFHVLNVLSLSKVVIIRIDTIGIIFRKFTPREFVIFIIIVR